MDETTLLLRSRKTEDRIKAAQRLVQNAGPEHREPLLTALHDRTHYVAALAAQALVSLADDLTLSKMEEAFHYFSEEGLKRDPGCHIRAQLAYAFGNREYYPAYRALRLGIRTRQIEPVGGVPFDTAAHLRANCALSLAQLRAPDALRDITLVLFDTTVNERSESHHDAAVRMEPRKAAAQALSLLGDRNALIPLTLRLIYPQGEEAEVLQECMQALVDLEDDRALEILEPYLQHRDAPLAAYAALMMARTRLPEVASLLMQALPRFTGNPLQAVLLVLTTLRTEEAHAALQELVESPREAVRLALVEALQGSRDENSLALLQRLAKDKTPGVKKAAMRALEA